MKHKLLVYLLGLFFICLIIFGGYNVLSIIIQNKNSKNIYNSLEKYTDEYDTIIWPLVDFESLKNINDDVVGWISIEKLDINYPILQGRDNDYYLNHLVDKSNNYVGSIFMDYRNNNNFEDKHTIIYGHNIQNGSMFSNLTKYMEQEFYDNNPYYLLVTPYKNYKVDIISAYVTNVDDSSWNLKFESDIEFNSWVKNTIDKSLINTDTVPKINDNIVTLSTCSYEFNDARFVLVGVLVEQE